MPPRAYPYILPWPWESSSAFNQTTANFTSNFFFVKGVYFHQPFDKTVQIGVSANRKSETEGS